MAQHKKSYLQMLDPIHNQGFRLALGDFRTSVASLYVEVDEPHREKHPLQYAIRLAAYPTNPLMKFHSHQNTLINVKRNLNLLNHLASEFHHF